MEVPGIEWGGGKGGLRRMGSSGMGGVRGKNMVGYARRPGGSRPIEWSKDGSAEGAHGLVENVSEEGQEEDVVEGERGYRRLYFERRKRMRLRASEWAGGMDMEWRRRRAREAVEEDELVTSRMVNKFEAALAEGTVVGKGAVAVGEERQSSLGGGLRGGTGVEAEGGRVVRWACVEGRKRRRLQASDEEEGAEAHEEGAMVTAQRLGEGVLAAAEAMATGMEGSGVRQAWSIGEGEHEGGEQQGVGKVSRKELIESLTSAVRNQRGRGQLGRSEVGTGVADAGEEGEVRVSEHVQNQPARVGGREDGGTNTGGGMSQSSSWRGSRPPGVSESAVGMEVEEDDSRALRRRSMNQPAEVDEREDSGTNTGGGMSRKQLIARLTSAVCERERSGHGGGGG